MRKIKCKYCNELILREEDLFCISKKIVKGKERKSYVHIQCLDDYKELMEYKKYETTWFSTIYEHIKELLGYDSSQDLPNFLITRIKDLRNGTIIKYGIGRVNKSKEGYPYPVILDTFLDNGDSIRWHFSNKTFDTETQKINYMMAIIDSNINNNYLLYKNKLDTTIVKHRDNIIEEEKVIENNKKENLIIHTNIISKKKNGISKFLNDDEI